MNKAGGSIAFGKWASKRIKTRIGAQLATMVLGILIFVDDYFNCLTVGSVMRPVTDTHKVSRANCPILLMRQRHPVFVLSHQVVPGRQRFTSSVPEDSGINGLLYFYRQSPYNLYAILTLVMIVGMVVVFRADFGPMRTQN